MHTTASRTFVMQEKFDGNWRNATLPMEQSVADSRVRDELRIGRKVRLMPCPPEEKLPVRVPEAVKQGIFRACTLRVQAA